MEVQKGILVEDVERGFGVHEDSCQSTQPTISPSEDRGHYRGVVVRDGGSLQVIVYERDVS